MFYFKVEAPGYLTYQSDFFEVKEGSGIHQNIELKKRLWWLGIFNWEQAVLVLAILLILYNFYRDRKRKNYLKIKN